MNNIRRRPKWMRNSAMVVKYYEKAIDIMDEAVESNDEDKTLSLCRKSAKYLNKAARWNGFKSYNDMIEYLMIKDRFAMFQTKQEL